MLDRVTPFTHSFLPHLPKIIQTCVPTGQGPRRAASAAVKGLGFHPCSLTRMSLPMMLTRSPGTESHLLESIVLAALFLPLKMYLCPNEQTTCPLRTATEAAEAEEGRHSKSPSSRALSKEGTANKNRP